LKDQIIAWSPSLPGSRQKYLDKYWSDAYLKYRLFERGFISFWAGAPQAETNSFLIKDTFS